VKPCGEAHVMGFSVEDCMDKKSNNPIRISSAINLLAGVLWVIAAFHPITGGTGVDYWFIVFGVFFMAAGIVGLYQARK
jgi:hypothetical protein